MKECPNTCEDYRLDYCGACRQTDDKSCERVCPQGINLVEGGSLAKCTKCFDCYIECEKGAVVVEVVGKSDAYESIKRFLKRKPKAQSP
jgi:Fe-S-cluster-containing hydrogenase component 2